MKDLLIGLGALAILAGASPALATTTIDFEEFAHAGAPTYYRELESKGFLIDNPDRYSDSVTVLGSDDPLNADPGGATFSAFRGGPWTRITRPDYPTTPYGYFDLISLDVADAYNDGFGGNLTFVVNQDYNNLIRVALDHTPGLQTVTLNLTGVYWLSIYSDRIYTQLDNIVVDFIPDTPSAAPEPASWALMIMGFAAIGAMVRRRVLRTCPA